MGLCVQNNLKSTQSDFKILCHFGVFVVLVGDFLEAGCIVFLVVLKLNLTKSRKITNLNAPISSVYFRYYIRLRKKFVSRYVFVTYKTSMMSEMSYVLFVFSDREGQAFDL